MCTCVETCDCVWVGMCAKATICDWMMQVRSYCLLLQCQCICVVVCLCRFAVLFSTISCRFHHWHTHTTTHHSCHTDKTNHPMSLCSFDMFSFHLRIHSHRERNMQIHTNSLLACALCSFNITFNWTHTFRVDFWRFHRTNIGDVRLCTNLHCIVLIHSSWNPYSNISSEHHTYTYLVRAFPVSRKFSFKIRIALTYTHKLFSSIGFKQ